MNAISIIDQVLRPDNFVTSMYESNVETLRKLECLYAGEDIASKSMRTALIIDGGGAEELEKQLDAELEQLLLADAHDKHRLMVMSARMSDEDLYHHLDQLRTRFAPYAEDADHWETQIYSDIHSYELPAMNIRVEVVIDYVDLLFCVSRPTSRHNIKKYLTEHVGKAYFIADTDCRKESEHQNFMIRLHDIKTQNDLKPVLKYLKHFGVKENDIKVNRIEVATDFYGIKNKAFLIALFKSLSYAENASNERIYKDDVGKFFRMPSQPYTLLTRLNKGYCIGVNPKGSPIYYRLYYKVTDQKRALPLSEHRIRAEVNCSVVALGIHDSLNNLSEIIQCAFDQMKLTKLNKSASPRDKENYRQNVDMFGLRSPAYYSSNRHVRTLKPHISKNGEINKLISKKVSNLKRNFK